MTDADNEIANSSSDDEDRLVEQLLSHLKQLTPPPASQLANRKIVATELARLQAKWRNREKRWWQKTVAVPVPVALGIAALLLIALGAQLNPLWTTDQPMAGTLHTNESAGHGADGHSKGNTDSSPSVATRTPPNDGELEYHETNMYLCGIGLLSSERGYFIREQ